MGFKHIAHGFQMFDVAAYGFVGHAELGGQIADGAGARLLEECQNLSLSLTLFHLWPAFFSPWARADTPVRGPGQH